jgi:shikimate kinase
LPVTQLGSCFFEKQCIVFVGLPGSGKSTIGRLLAKRLGWSFVDTDIEIENRLGCSIREYFEREGEDCFRDVEESVIAELTSVPLSSQAGLSDAGKSVISTGGGAVLRKNNRDRLISTSFVVYLRCTPEDIYKRIRHDRNRPLLQVAEPMQRLRDLFMQRDGLYSQTAHFEVDTGRASSATLVNTLLVHLPTMESDASTKFNERAKNLP